MENNEGATTTTTVEDLNDETNKIFDEDLYNNELR